MSRIGQMPITVPSNVTVEMNGQEISVKGPKGELKRTISPRLNVEVENGVLTIKRSNDERESRAMHGLTRTLVNNMVTGVTNGFQKKLELVGVGFRVDKDKDNIILKLGYTHSITVTPRPGISFEVDSKNTGITVNGIDKEVVGQTAAEIRRLRVPDHYKGKGIRYEGEVIKLKAGKSGKAVGGKK